MGAFRFAVIFSIPKITEWVQSMDAGSVSAYYTQFKLTLEGQTSTDEHTTQADEITGFINEWSNFDHKYTSYADYKASLDKDAKDMIEKYGEKFYLVYVGKDCTNCETIQPGFEALQENWGSSYVADDSRSFKMYTIFSDEESTNDDDFDTDDNKKENKTTSNRTMREAADHVYKKLSTYAKTVANQEKNSPNLLITDIPANAELTLYPTEESWYYIKEHKVYAYINLKLTSKSYDFCYNGSIENTKEGKCA